MWQVLCTVVFGFISAGLVAFLGQYNITQTPLNFHRPLGLSPSVKGRFSTDWGRFSHTSSLGTDAIIRSLRQHFTAVLEAL